MFFNKRFLMTNTVTGIQTLVVLGLLAMPSFGFGDEGSNAAEANNVNAWVKQGEQLRENGELIAAQHEFSKALQFAGTDNPTYPAIEAASGYNLFLLGKIDLAEAQLTDALQKVRGEDSYLKALIAQYLARLYLSQANYDLALRHIDQGLIAAKVVADEGLTLSLELMQLEIRNVDSPNLITNLLSLGERISKLPAGFVKAKLQFKLAQTLMGIDSQDAKNISAVNAVVYDALTNALAALDKANGQSRLKAELTASLAHLYHRQERNAEAILLINRAIVLANQDRSTELLLQLEATLAEYQLLQGDKEGALASYALAVNDLVSIRSDLPITMPDGKSAIDVLIDPIHRNYVDLLLQTASTSNSAELRSILAKSMENMEAIKEADMQDFFLGRCSIFSKKDNDWWAHPLKDAVIVYPILLKDRIELLVKNGEEISRHTINVDGARVREQAASLQQALHSGKDYRSAAKDLYQWLFAPLKQALEARHVTTIVYVPDRSLRAVPFSVLNDGRQFLVEKYAIVTLPGLSFQDLNTQTPAHKNMHTLVAGLSKPDGASIDDLPENIVDKLLNKSDKSTIVDNTKSADRYALIKELSLPNIEQEIQSVGQNYQSRTLLNNQFTASALRSDIETGNYGKVHIASHGYFGKNAKDSFVMAYDKNLTLLDFEGSLGSDRLKQQPLDLLTLSACETAEGDDRMLLGFSGLAVKSNVLSAIGSLWAINDQAAMEFMRLFYDGLSNSLNKAQAMQQAQVAMIKSKKFRHPFYWSPFILIGSWQ